MGTAMRDLNEPKSDRGFFRCPVQDDESSATIHILGKKIPVQLQDRSIDGFSVMVEPRHSRKLQMGPQWILQAGDERVEVLAQWIFNAPDGVIQIGLRRLQDLTPQPKATWFPCHRPYRKNSSNPELLLAGVLLFLILVLSLPGIGDALGTSGTIQQGITILFETAKESGKQFW